MPTPAVEETNVPARNIRILFPTMVTLGALCFGLLSIKFSVAANFEKAIICIFIAALLDSVDGGVARLFRSSSQFGIQIDSLSDAVCFGVATTFLAYYWSLQTLGPIGWLMAVGICLATVLRLARYNVSVRTKIVYHKHFQGIPAPGGAILAIAPVAWQMSYGYEMSPALYAAYVSGVALLMISYIPTLALKHLQVAKRYRLIVLFLVGLFIAYSIQDYWAGIALGAILYWVTIPIISIPYYISRYRRKI